MRRRCGSSGRIDVLLSNAGYGFLGTFEEVPEQFAGQIDTNL
jgi:NAD(P)-dependent dehydrogenase (short-subunit alcohol dehydrogenase family)